MFNSPSRSINSLKMSETRELSSPDEEELDMTSERFNPLKALYSSKARQPENRRKFDNLSSLLSQIKKAGGSLDADLSGSIVQLKKDQQSKEEDEKKFHVTAAGRKFLKQQGRC